MSTKSKKRTSSGVSDNDVQTDVYVINKIALDELIPVVSLIDYPLNLLPQTNGRAKYRFDAFGQRKEILYQDLLLIMEQYASFMNGGVFLILDERVLNRHGLKETLNKVITKENIVKIIEGGKEAVELYKSCSDTQQKIIVGMITRKLAEDPDSMDLNIVDKISRLSKTDILSNAEDIRFLSRKEEKEEE